MPRGSSWPVRLALAALLVLPAPAARAAPPPALVAAAGALADALGPPQEGRRALLLAVESRAPPLAATLETALDAALSSRGYSVTPHRGAGDAEGSARAAGQDWLLRVRAGLVPGRREVALVGELIPAWASFFLQRHPDARAVPPRVVQARAPADPETLLLAREGRAGAPFASVRTLARLPGRVLALAVGEAGEPGRPVLVAATQASVTVLSPAGERIAARDFPAGALTPVRDPAATLAVGDFGGGRIAVSRAGAARAEVLALRGERLELAGALDAAPLCAGEAGRLFGAFVPGSGVLADVLAPFADPGAVPRSGRTLYGVQAAPRAGPIAFAALGTDLRLELLGRDLRPAAPGRASLATGSGFALADLDGDGTAEVVASSPDPSALERVRVLAPLAEAPLLLESAPIAGAILAGAGGDLTGDGVDDAVLAAVSTGPSGEAVTDLLLVTADPRELP